MKFHGGALLAIAMAAGSFGTGSANAEPRTVIELFTSQGCSSCPAADKLLGELAKDPSIIALSLPVDYWDYLGWKDTLASPLHTAKQRAYSRARGDREIYTPQVVVNGVIPVIGSDKVPDRGRHRADPRQGDGAAGAARMPSGDKLTVSVPDAKDGAAKGEVWLYGVTGTAPVTIGTRRKCRTQDHLLQRRAPAGESRRLDRQGGELDDPWRIRSAPTASMAPLRSCKAAARTSPA